MSKYIDADKIKWREEYQECRCHNDIWDEKVTRVYKRDIDKMPAADVAPVVHGHWETPEKQFPFWNWKCSACGCEEYRQRDSHGNYRRMNFCPNCGAKMDESEDKSE